MIKKNYNSKKYREVVWVEVDTVCYEMVSTGCAAESLKAQIVLEDPFFIDDVYAFEERCVAIPVF